LDIEIPANTSATVLIPAAGFENNRVAYKVGSGKHTFISKHIDDFVKPVHLPVPLISGGESLFHKPNEALITIEASPDADVWILKQ